MGNRLYDNEFENFLKDQANQHRMYPSDQVWRNIQGEVHGYRKWPALTVIAVFIIAALVVGTVAVKPRTELLTQQTTQVPVIEKTQPITKEPVSLEANKVYAGHLSVNNITQETIEKVKETIRINETESLLIASSNEQQQINNNVVISVNTSEKNIDKTSIVTEEQQGLKPADKEEVIAVAKNFDAAFHTAVLPDSRFIFSNNLGFVNTNYNFSNAVYKDEFSFVRTNNSNLLNVELAPSKPAQSGSPLSRIGKRSSKLDFQFYVAPSISYRRLLDDAEGTLSKSYVTAIPYESNYVVDLNQAIQHRPAAGYEVGFSLGYNLGKKFAVRSGMQFNTRQYNIDAFVHSAEPATVSLSANNSNLVLNTVSGFRNIDGSKPIELKNRYYEISVPIGIDWRPVNKKFAWGIAASIQPTYTFDKEPFIITSNFKNYADGSQLMRNWNINANVETYLGYNTGKYRWQIGPQLRYQLMPTMANSFPIREYPVDLGIKLGLIRSLR
ncbi:hypothetical protein BH10BAC2_BH10BAC2_44770 [soil metagenome]